jgi:hypothetical protein
VLLRATGDRRITRRQESQMIQIRTSQTCCTLFSSQDDPSVVAQVLPTFITLRFSISDEHFELIGFRHFVLHYEIVALKALCKKAIRLQIPCEYLGLLTTPK